MKPKFLIFILVVIFIFGITKGYVLGETVKLEIPSGVKIKCFYYKSLGEEKRPTILFLPGLSGLRSSNYNDIYKDFAIFLRKKYNFNVLIIDYRGKTNEEMLKFVNMGGLKMLVEQEVATALDYLRKQKNVDGEMIGLVGFSLGTIVAIMAAAQENCIKALALVSLIARPSEDFKPVFLHCATRPILFLAAKDDYIPQNKTNAAENTLYWSQQGKGVTKVEITEGKKHSAELLEWKGFQEMIGEWFKEHLTQK